MKCETCGNVYPSKHYFRSETVCLTCYRKEHPEDANPAFVEVGPRRMAGRDLTCPHCGHDQFRHRETLMNTRGLTFLGMEWANAEAQNYICARCGLVTWFMPPET